MNVELSSYCPYGYSLRPNEEYHHHHYDDLVYYYNLNPYRALGHLYRYVPWWFCCRLLWLWWCAASTRRTHRVNCVLIVVLMATVPSPTTPTTIITTIISSVSPPEGSWLGQPTRPSIPWFATIIWDGVRPWVAVPRTVLCCFVIEPSCWDGGRWWLEHAVCTQSLLLALRLWSRTPPWLPPSSLSSCQGYPHGASPLWLLSHVSLWSIYGQNTHTGIRHTALFLL